MDEIVLTGSISTIGKPLTQKLVKKGHLVTVISSRPNRKKEIETLGAQAAIGKMQDVDFLTETFKAADIVYLMETVDAVGGDMLDKGINLIESISDIGRNYKNAIEKSGKRIVIIIPAVSMC